jgi:hypothetical protein
METIADSVINTSGCDLENIDIPLVISYETDIANNNAAMFKKTLNKNGWQYIFIGEGIKWNGFRDRVFAYYKQLELLNDDKIVILSDARDVFCLRTPNFFINNIKNIVDKQIIISAEMFLNGHINWSSDQIANAISSNQHFFWQGVPLIDYWAFCNKTNDLPFRKYLNAGLIVGKVSLLKNALQWIIDNNFNDDQLGFSKYTNQYPELVYLDYEAKYIHTSTGFVDASLYNHEIQIQDVPSFVELFGLSNYFLHIPGSNISKGQKHVYSAIYNLFEHNCLEKSMFNLYNLTGDRKHSIFISNDP